MRSAGSVTVRGSPLTVIMALVDGRGRPIPGSVPQSVDQQYAL